MRSPIRAIKYRQVRNMAFYIQGHFLQVFRSLAFDHGVGGRHGFDDERSPQITANNAVEDPGRRVQICIPRLARKPLT